MKKIFILFYLFLFYSQANELLENSFELKPQVSYNFTDIFVGNSKIDSYLSSGISIAYLPKLTENLIDEVAYSFEYANANYQKETNLAQNNGNIYKHSLSLKHYFASKRDKLISYITIGNSYFNYQHKTDNFENSYAFDYGFGAKYKINSILSFDFELKQSMVFAQQINDITTMTMGLVVGFFKRELPPIDSDGDGILNFNDMCLNTPKNAKVDINGCEIIDEFEEFDFSTDELPEENNSFGNTNFLEEAKSIKK
jgi:opacity protein-like surface antigen